MSEPNRAGTGLPAEVRRRTASAVSLASFRPLEKWSCTVARRSTAVALSLGLTRTTLVASGGRAVADFHGQDAHATTLRAARKRIRLPAALRKVREDLRKYGMRLLPI